MERATGSPSTPLAATKAGSSSANPDLTGKTLGDFQILRRLGQGGMGQVYLAKQLSLDRKVAFKVLKADLAANTNSLKRFQAEATAAARATHANIVQVYAIGEQDGLNFMALEYIEGCNLRQYLDKKGTPTVALAMSIIRQVASALQRAAELGIIHRDIKPENILLTRKGEVKVADFGLSRCFAGDGPILNLTQSGVTLGTPLYMSPEQVQGHPLDPRTDIYALGVTCYHMLSGQPPFRGQTPFEVALQHVQAQPEPLAKSRPDLPPELCAMVDRMMAKKPEDRYQAAGDILQDLTRLRKSLTATQAAQETPAISMPQISPSGSAVVSLPREGKPRLRWLAAGSIFLALVAGALLGWRHNQSSAVPASQETPPAGKELSSQEKWEKLLEEQVKKTANPTKDRDQVSRGLTPRIELGLLYLEQWRLDDADRFYNELANEPNQVPAYRFLGRLGHGVVLAFQDQAVESNKVFLELFVEKKIGPNERKWKWGLVNRNHQFHAKIAEALDRNEANKQPISTELEELRKPSSNGGDKGPKKSS